MIESIYYNVSVAVTSAIRGASFEKLHQELGFESLRSRRWFKKLFLFCTTCKNKICSI